MNELLIKDILKYIVPLRSKDKRDFAKEEAELCFLESLVKKLEKEPKEAKRRRRVSKDTALEEILKVTEEKETKQKHADYSLRIEREAENKALQGYSVSIKYHEDDSEERIDIEVKPDKAKKEQGEEDYAFSLAREKARSERKKGYSIDIQYDGAYKKEHVTINYNIPLLNYEEKQEINKQDFSNLASNKWVDVFPESLMGGVLGFTYLGDNYQALRADMLYSPLGKMVDLHEAIHTPDEHETRVLTEWMLDVKKPAYKQ